MPNDPSHPSGPAWRQKVTGGRRNPQAQKAWQKEAEVSVLPTPRWTRKTKVGVAAAGLLGVVGLLVGVILWWLPPRSPTLVLIGADYPTNLAIPPNVYGWQGLHALAEWVHSEPQSSFWGTSGLPRLLHEGPRQLHRDGDWAENLFDNRFKERTVVVFFAVHGGVDHKGAYLLPNDARPDPEDPKNRVRLDKVFQTLADEKLKDKHKILILDVTQVASNWPFGMLANDFARALEETVERHKVPNLIVINSSDAGQRSWTCPEVRQTIFSYYLLEGLKGGAVAETNGSTINAWELYDYVKRRVYTWVRDNRATLQEPILLPRDQGRQMAEHIKMTQVVQPYQQPDLSKAPAEVWTPALAKQWDECLELSKQVPAPYVLHPKQWREYQARLVRYEQLLRAGDQANADKMKDQLATLGRLLRGKPLENLNAVENTLPMPAALGVPVPAESRQQIQERWTRLWAAPEEKWQQDKGTMADKLVRLRYLGRLLDEVVNNADRANLAKAARLVPVLCPGAMRPAEAHYLAMLNRDLDRTSSPPAKDLQLAVQVNRLAEEVALAMNRDEEAEARGAFHPYSDRVYPWIQRQVAEADQERLRGQDLLLATEKVRWDEARGHLEKAKKLYLDAGRDAALVRSAFAVRDQVLDGLPAYSHWLAGRWLQRSEVAQAEDKMQRVEDLWRSVHYLHRLLEKPDPRLLHPDPANPNQPGVPLKDLPAKIRGQFNALQREFADYCKNELDDRLLPQRWHEIEDVLGVFWIDPETRGRLLGYSQSISHRLFLESLKPRDPKNPPPIPEPPDVRGAAQRQGRLALAALGEPWITDQAKGATLDFGTLLKKVVRPDERHWEEDLGDASYQLGHYWRQFPIKINELTDHAAKPDTDLAAAVTDLAGADLLCRQIDPTGIDMLKADGAAECQRLHLHNLLIGLARRTIDDHWFAENPDPTTTPYYQLAADKLVTDVLKLVEGPGGKENRRMTTAKNLKEELKHVTRMSFQNPLREKNVTSEPKFKLAYQLEGDPKLPPGYAVIQMKADSGLDQSEDAASPGTRRAVRSLDPTKKDGPVTYVFNHKPDQAKDPADSKLTVEALYRGQKITQPTAVHLYYRGDTVMYRTPPPPYGGLAVRTDERIEAEFAPDRGTMVIILDCSGSMCEPLKADAFPAKRKQVKTKFDKALDALERVLTELEPGVTLSLWIFSDKETYQLNKNKPDPYDQLIRRLRAPSKWDRTQIGSLMTDLRKLHPYYETPLVESMFRAKPDFPSERDGSKTGHQTLVVLTDGEDSEFNKDKARYGGLTIPAFLEREFGKSNIEINVVFFEAAKGEVEQAMRDFGSIRDWPLPGHLYNPEKDTVQLFRDLKEAMHPQLHCRLFDLDGKALKPKDGVLVTRPQVSKLEWFPRQLLPTSYTAQVHHKYQQKIELGRGDFLLVNLKKRGDLPVFERALFADELGIKDRRQAKGDWLLAVLQDQGQARTIGKGQGLELMVTLENTKVQRDPDQKDIVKQVRPEFVWLEVKADDPNLPFTVRWGNLWGAKKNFPAPAWLMEVEGWPRKPTPPKVSAWWTVSDLENYPHAHLERDMKKNLAEAFTAPPGADFQIEDVSIEKHRLDGTDGVSCLVVRLHHAPGKPVLVRPNKLRYNNVEHQLYNKAQQYTGIFGPVTADDADKAFSLDIFSLTQFKAETKAQGNAIEDWPLPAPSDQFRRPQPVPEQPRIED
jgi:hypothetical protein